MIFKSYQIPFLLQKPIWVLTVKPSLTFSDDLLCSALSIHYFIMLYCTCLISLNKLYVALGEGYVFIHLFSRLIIEPGTW